MPGLVPGIHVFSADGKKIRGWPGHRRAEATPFFERLCPAMTSKYHAPAIVFSIAAIGQIQVSAFTSLGSRR